MGAGPRANYVCERCDPQGQQPFEAPVTGAHCSACGRKRWLRRLYNHVNISAPGFYRVNRLVDVEVANALERQHDQRDADIARQKRQAPALAVPIGKLSFALQRIHPAFGFGAPPGDKARPAGEGFQHPVSHQIRGRPPRPGPGSVDLGGKVSEAGE